MFAYLNHGAQCSFKVAHIVHGVKYAEHIYAVYSSPFNKFLYHIIGIVTVAENILTAKQHLLWRVGHGFLDLANAVPRVFTQKANTGIKCSPTP